MGRESGHLHTHTPHPESAGSHRLLRVYAGRLSFLPFSTEEETHIKIHELHFFKELSNRKPFSLRFRNQFAPHGTIKLKTKRALCTYRGAFYPLRQACRLISVMMAVQMSTKEKDAVVPRWNDAGLTQGIPDKENLDSVPFKKKPKTSLIFTRLAKIPGAIAVRKHSEIISQNQNSLSKVLGHTELKNCTSVWANPPFVT